MYQKTSLLSQGIIKALFTLIALLVISFAFTSMVSAATITVNTTNGDLDVPGDSNCSLREALTNANTNSDTTSGDCAAGEAGPTVDTIAFNLGAGVQTITFPATNGIPHITDSVTIDGIVGNPAATCGTTDLSDRSLQVEVNFSGVNGFVLDAGSENSLIRGVAVYGSNGDGIHLGTVASGFALECSHIGIDAPGVSIMSRNMDNGIGVTGSTTILSDITIGGPDILDANVISGSNNTGLDMSGRNIQNLRVENNFFGTDITGLLDLGNYCQGIEIDPGDSTITLVQDIEIISNTFAYNGLAPSYPRGCGTSPKAGVGIGGSHPVDTGFIDGFVFEDNLVFLNDRDGISIGNAQNGVIQNNLIGTDESGLIARSNGVSATGASALGITNSQDVQIIDNTIAGNDNPNIIGGVVLTPAFDPPFPNNINIILKGNNIGVGSDGSTPLPNNNYGIVTLGSDNSLIGGASIIDANIIANHLGAGVGILDTPLPAVIDISILQNSIYNNTLGIDILNDTVGMFNPVDWLLQGPNVNDIGDTDTGANNYLNYPVIYDASVDLSGTPANPTDDTTSIDFYLDIGNDSITRDVRVEFFSNGNTGLGDTIPATLHGEGKDFIIACDITHNGNGVQTYNTTTEGCDLTVSSGEIISSTATLRNVATPSTFGSTSEFGNTIEVESIGIDTGDAPDLGLGFGVGDYQTDVTDNGAYHLVTDSVTKYLGSCVDANPYTLGNTPANGDDLDIGSPVAGTCATAGDDEDGVAFIEPLTWGTASDIEVTASDEGELYIWIDFNQNGSFEDAGELVRDGSLNANDLNAGLNTLSLTMPAGAGATTTYARFRYNTKDINGPEGSFALRPVGESLDGEVEDYQVTIIDPGASTIDGTLTNTTLSTNPDGITIELYIDNGIIGTYEPGIDTLVSSQATSGGGKYIFTNIPAGAYLLQPVPPTNYTTTAVVQTTDGISVYTTATTIQQVSITPPTVNTQSTTSTTPIISGTYDDTNLTPDQVTITIDGTVYTDGDPGVTIAGGTWSVDLSLTTQTLTAGSSYEVIVDTDNGAGLTASDSTTNEITITTPSSGGGSGGGSVKFICKDPEATNYDASNFGRHKQSKCEYEFDTCFQSIDPECSQPQETTNTLTEQPTTSPEVTNIFDPATQCDYFQGYWKKGDQGYEVAKLQDFLNQYMGTNLIVDGDFGKSTKQAVKDFQEKHRADILDPWNLKQPTGHWYKTTQGNANEILGCHVEDRFLEDVNVINKFDNETLFDSFKGFVKGLF